MLQYFVVDNAVRLKDRVDLLLKEGIAREQIYIFSRYENRADDIAEALHISQVGRAEQGVMNSIKNLFTSRESELRTQLMALGMTEEQAKTLDVHLDAGKLIIVAKSATSD